MTELEQRRNKTVQQSLQHIFDETWREEFETGNPRLVEKGFFYFDEGEGEFQILANSVTGETIVEMCKDSRIKDRIEISGQKVAAFLTSTARILGIDALQKIKITGDLGILDAQDMKLYTMKDTRSLFQRVKDAF